MSCGFDRTQLSPYLDGELGVNESCQVLRHVESCADCRRYLEQLRCLGEGLRALPAAPMPVNLALRLRVAASHSAADMRPSGYWSMRLREAFRAMAVPAVAGMMGACCLFGLIFGSVDVNHTLFTRGDVPLSVNTPPEVLRMDGANIGGAVTVEATVDPSGRVEDYRILSGSHDPRVISRLNNALLFSVFKPAMQSGTPTTGQVLLSYDSIRVRG